MAANCAAIENAGKWRGCLPGCTTSADSSLDGNTTSRTSSASSTLPAFTCCSDIYETSSRSDGGTRGTAAARFRHGLVCQRQLEKRKKRSSYLRRHIHNRECPRRRTG